MTDLGGFGKNALYNMQLTPATLKRLPWECIVPYNSEQLLLIASPTIAFGIFSLTNEKLEPFSIMSFVDANKNVFGEVAFKDRLSEFASIFEARIERFFITKKSPYLFFDAEEQQFLQRTFAKFRPTSYMEIFTRENQMVPFERKEFVDLSPKEFKEIFPYVKRMNPQIITNFERFYVQFREYEQKRKDKLEELRKRNEESFMKEMFARYPFIKDIKDQIEFKRKYRELARKYHPDTGGDEEIFSQISTDFTEIAKTTWFDDLDGKARKKNATYNKVLNFFKGGEEDELASNEGQNQ